MPHSKQRRERQFGRQAPRIFSQINRARPKFRKRRGRNGGGASLGAGLCDSVVIGVPKEGRETQSLGRVRFLARGHPPPPTLPVPPNPSRTKGVYRAILRNKTKDKAATSARRFWPRRREKDAK